MGKVKLGVRTCILRKKNALTYQLGSLSESLSSIELLTDTNLCSRLALNEAKRTIYLGPLKTTCIGLRVSSRGRVDRTAHWAPSLLGGRSKARKSYTAPDPPSRMGGPELPFLGREQSGRFGWSLHRDCQSYLAPSRISHSSFAPIFLGGGLAIFELVLICRKIPRSEIKSIWSFFTSKEVGILVSILCVLIRSLTTDILPETGHALPSAYREKETTSWMKGDCLAPRSTYSS